MVYPKVRIEMMKCSENIILPVKFYGKAKIFRLIFTMDNSL